MRDMEYSGYINSINTANSAEEIQEMCTQFFLELGFDKFIYGSRMPTSFLHPDVHIVNGYPAEWRERYDQLNYISIDPTVNYCSKNILPLDWADLHCVENVNPAIGEFMNEARDFGLQEGVSFSLHSAQGEFAMLSLASSDQRHVFRKKIQKILPYGQMFFAHLHEAIRRTIDDNEVMKEEQTLTKREKECLLWAADGKTSWEIANIIMVSESTVVHYLQSAMKKMHADNRQHAIARAVARGLIVPHLG